MKYKSYIIVLLIAMVLGIGKTYAVNINSQGNISMHGSNEIIQKYTPINTLKITCKGLFGSKKDPDSLRSLINEILEYPRIIVPVLVIVLGMIDLAKAVVASKEDEIKAAQKLLVKRAIYALAIFFVVLIVQVVFGLLSSTGNSQIENEGASWQACWNKA